MESSPIRVLIIEDNPIDRDLFRRFLRPRDGLGSVECVEVEQGSAGLEQFRSVHPDCVLLDLNLPDIDGLDLLHSVLSEPGACPVVVTTAYGSEQVAVTAMKAGAADYLVKGSITEDNLVHVIRNAMEKRALQREVERQRLAIEQSEYRYRTLAEAMPQLVWTANHADGGWDYVNERWTRLTGTPCDRALQRGWLEFIDEDDRARVTAAWEAAIAGGAPLELECRMTCAGGSSRWQLMRALPLLQDDRPRRWLGTFTDVDDQRRTEQLLHQRQKLESIGILAGGVAHDFNNLLVGIIGGVSFALDILPENHEVRGVLEGALKSGDRAAHLTRQLLAYAGKGRFQVDNVDLAQNLHSTWQLLQASLARSVDLKVTIPPDLPPIRTDPTQLQQIIMNLVLNASEAIPEDRHGIVVVRGAVERLDAPQSSWNGDLSAGDYVAIEVHDNGSGIDPALLNRIFDPFFTTKFTGRGLGLAAVHGIVQSNKGSIAVSSTPGQGSTFRVLLPAGATAPKPLEHAAATASAGSVKGRILIVDDEEIVRNTARVILQRSGHTVDTVSSGDEALERISAHQDIALVLLDLNMPGLDGRQTLKAIRRAHPCLPIVICSGYSDAEIRTKFQHEHVNGFLQKPFQFRALVATVSEILNPG
jgi:PAS domain S-box-containing protein